jgi:hypothetical protein
MGGQSSTSAGTHTAASSSATGEPIDAGAECQPCRDMECEAQENACKADPQCAQFLGCLTEPELCCQALNKQPANDTAHAAYACIHEKCAEKCNLAPANCLDCFKNGPESDVDCGDDACKACASGKKCNWSNDCASAVCDAGVCQ